MAATASQLYSVGGVRLERPFKVGSVRTQDAGEIALSPSRRGDLHDVSALFVHGNQGAPATYGPRVRVLHLPFLRTPFQRTHANALQRPPVPYRRRAVGCPLALALQARLPRRGGTLAAARVRRHPRNHSALGVPLCATGQYAVACQAPRPGWPLLVHRRDLCESERPGELPLPG